MDYYWLLRLLVQSLECRLVTVFFEPLGMSTDEWPHFGQSKSCQCRGRQKVQG